MEDGRVWHDLICMLLEYPSTHPCPFGLEMSILLFIWLLCGLVFSIWKAFRENTLLRGIARSAQQLECYESYQFFRDTAQLNEEEMIKN